jgi:hypothetical protein
MILLIIEPVSLISAGNCPICGIDDDTWPHNQHLVDFEKNVTNPKQNSLSEFPYVK